MVTSQSANDLRLIVDNCTINLSNWLAISRTNGLTKSIWSKTHVICDKPLILPQKPLWKATSNSWQTLGFHFPKEYQLWYLDMNYITEFLSLYPPTSSTPSSPLLTRLVPLRNKCHYMSYFFRSRSIIEINEEGKHKGSIDNMKLDKILSQKKSNTYSSYLVEHSYEKLRYK